MPWRVPTALPSTMNLVIDIGNTLQKLAVFDENEKMVCLFHEDKLTETLLEPLFVQYPIENAIVSSVGKNDEAIMKWLEAHSHLLQFSPACRLPITLRYATPETLGTDRIANAVGANALCPGENVLSIMAGTCLVADFVNANGEYIGGSIAPGLRMRFQSLSKFTARLPLVEPDNIDFLIGNSTQDSILSGVINGMAHEISGMIDHFRQIYNPIKVLFSGGDAELLLHYIKKRIFAAQNPTLLGLLKILKLNASKN